MSRCFEMENSRAEHELLYDLQERAGIAQARLLRHEHLKRFALVFALVVLTVAVAMIIARLSERSALTVPRHMTGFRQ